MRIALDCHVSNSIREALKDETVVQAQDGEPDEVWFRRAVEAGATHIYSGDSDLEYLCCGTQVTYIKARPGRSLKNQLRLIRKVG